MSRHTGKISKETLAKGIAPEKIKSAETPEIIQRVGYLSRYTGLTPRGKRSLDLMAKRLENEAKELENEIWQETRGNRTLTNREEDLLIEKKSRLGEISNVLGRGFPTQLMSVKELNDEKAALDRQARAHTVRQDQNVIGKINKRRADINIELILREKSL